MSQYVFGAGFLYGTPVTDSTGAAVTNPTPSKFGVLQDVALDLSFEQKMLYGQNSFPVDVGRGKGKISLKAKAANIDSMAYNNLFFGQTRTVGLLTVRIDVTGTAIPSTPFTITPTVPSSGTFSKDLGVTANGIAYQRVASAPASGQYMVNEASGLYTFAAADTGVIVFIDFEYTKATGGNKITITNQPMGYTPSFIARVHFPYKGKQLTWVYNNCVSSKLSMGSKLDDYMIPEFDFDAFADANGVIGYLDTTE